MAAMMSRDPSTLTAGSLSPWKHQHGRSPSIFSAVATCPPVRRRGRLPPILFRIRGGQAPGAIATHAESGQVDPFRVGLIFLHHIIEHGQWLVSAFGPRRPANSWSPACGMRVMNGNVFSRFLIAGPIPTSTGCLPTPLPPALVSPESMKEEDDRIDFRPVVVLRNEHNVWRLVSIGVHELPWSQSQSSTSAAKADPMKVKERRTNRARVKCMRDGPPGRAGSYPT